MKALWSMRAPSRVMAIPVDPGWKRDAEAGLALPSAACHVSQMMLPRPTRWHCVHMLTMSVKRLGSAGVPRGSCGCR